MATMSPVPVPGLSSSSRVVDDSVAFWDSLRRFHFVMGSRFMIPVIGGKELDLHALYVEVTQRGGYDRVVAEKKWRQVACALNLPPTATSSSYVLKKHYSTLLYNYEQLSPPKIRQHCPDLNGVGTIDGKFDCGYLVSVKVGWEILRGVLYHHPTVPESSCAIVPYTSKPGQHGRKRRERDPNHPKPNRSGYNFYFAEKHFELNSLHRNRERGELTKMIAESWTNLGPDERMVYQNMGLKDKERYQRELKEYRDNFK